jgi:hypothetical protein
MKAMFDLLLVAEFRLFKGYVVLQGYVRYNQPKNSIEKKNYIPF